MGEVDAETDSEAIPWRRVASATVSPPIVRRLPYLEVKLEHSGIEPTGRGDRFFPDAVPYSLDGASRVFYWRPVLSPSTNDAGQWELACGTTHELIGFDALPAQVPPLVTHGANGVTLVVDGTVGGETTTVHVDSYEDPSVRIERVVDSAVELTVADSVHTVDRETRTRIPLQNRRVEPSDSDGGATTATPELVVRYPGNRELHHPAPGANYRLFPSFGLDLDDLPDPVPVPTAAGELDDGALATALGADLSERPYPEGVLWQAFAHTAFDPHSKTTTELAQHDDGHLVVRTENVDE